MKRAPEPCRGRLAYAACEHQREDSSYLVTICFWVLVLPSGDMAHLLPLSDRCCIRKVWGLCRTTTLFSRHLLFAQPRLTGSGPYSPTILTLVELLGEVWTPEPSGEEA